MGMTPVAGRIFVSYRRDDSAYATGWLADRLTEHYGAEQVFTDVDSIEIGDDFVTRITKAVASCDVLLAVIGLKWLTIEDGDGRRRLDDSNDYVRIEIEAALRRGVLVIPILVDGATMPRVTDLPGTPTEPGAEPDPHSLASLPRREALSLNPSQFDWAVGRLLGKLDKVLPKAEGIVPQGHSRREADAGESVAPDRAEPLLAAARWTTVGLLLIVIATMLISWRFVMSDVRAARPNQPQVGVWIAVIWMAPAIPAAVAALRLLIGGQSRLGTVLGSIVVSGWMVANSWAFLAYRKASGGVDSTHGGLHVLLGLLLLGATAGVATAAPVREGVHLNPPSRTVPAVFLAVLGLVLLTESLPIREAIYNGGGVDWGAWPDNKTTWIGAIVPFAVCLVAAIVACNGVQSRALRTFIGIIVVYETVILASTVAYSRQEESDRGDLVGFLVWAFLSVVGSLLLWRSVRAGQPIRRELPRRPSGPAVTTITGY